MVLNPIEEAGLVRFRHPQHLEDLVGPGVALGDLHLKVRVGGDVAALAGILKALVARDDAAPGVFPGAEEVWYDGLDQDCDGVDDFDQDGDGVPVEFDCDDAQEGLGECEVSVGGGCRTAAPWAGWMAVLSAILVATRRARA